MVKLWNKISSNVKQNLGIFLIALVFFIFVPRLFGLEYISGSGSMLNTHKLIGLKLLGYDYKFSILETPKPLVDILLIFSSINIFNFLIPLACAAWLVCACYLCRRYTGSAWDGVFVFLLFIFSNTVVLPDFVFLNSGISAVYFAWLMLAVICFSRGSYGWCALMLLGGGLVRPEAWVASFLFVGWVLLKHRKEFRKKYLICLAAPFLWILFDWRISGDFFYSSHQIHNYCKVSGFVPIDFKSFWLMLAFFIRHYFGLFIVVIGSAGAIATVRWFKSADGGRAVYALMVLAVIPIGLYAMNALCSEDLFLYPRFFVSLLFFASFGVVLLSAALIKNKLLRTCVLSFILLIAFRSDMVVGLYKAHAVDRTKSESINNVFSFLDGYLPGHKIKGQVALGSSVDAFSSRYGTIFSKQTVNIRELGSNLDLLDKLVPGIFIWIPFDSTISGSRFDFLASPQDRLVSGYIFSPLFIGKDGMGIVYSVKRERKLLVR